MNTQTIERFTARIAKTHDGPLEDVGYFADFDSAELWAQALLHNHEAVSARVVRIRLAARPSVEGLLFLRDVGKAAD